jgi:two-component sensor histidine kinase
LNELIANAGLGRETSATAPMEPWRKLFWLSASIWTAVVTGSLAWNLVQHAKEVRSLTVQAARALLEKDLLYREWSILHGGVYVPKSSQPETPSTPADPEREIVTPSGRELTLLNPAVVSRRIFKLQEQRLGIVGHITSLNPLRAANGPDAWEREALQRFGLGATEVSGTEKREGEVCFRMMLPLRTVTACLQCHEERVHQPGEIRGGISVTVPLCRFVNQGEPMRLVVAHVGLWLIGVVGLVHGTRNLEKHSRKRQQADQALRDQYELTRTALHEKHALLQEIHHRVKNNLQVISSLLQLQIKGIRDPLTLEIFRENQLRIRSMGLIHEKLHESESQARVDLAAYLRSLTSLLICTYAPGRGQVRLDLVLDQASLGLDAAIPLGLIANELITNSLKYAFPGDRRGVIRVELRTESGDWIRFQVADDGVGFAAGVPVERPGSLGMRLVSILVKQLGGEGTWDKVQVGTSFTLQFRNKG